MPTVPAKMVVVSLADFTDEELITRMQWLARNLYYDGEQGKIYTDVIEVFRETKHECERRGLTRFAHIRSPL